MSAPEPSSRRRSRARSLTVALVALASCAGPASEAPPSRFRLAPPVAHAPRVEPIDVEHYALAIELEPATRSIEGRCRVRFVALEPLTRIELDYEGPAVDGVEDAAGRALAFAHEDGRLAIELREPVERGAVHEVLVRYSGAPRKGLWFVAERDGVPTQVFTQGECEDARWWFPCIDHPGERATSELSVTMPAGWRATAAGERIDRALDGRGRATERWRMTAPHPSYLETLVAGELAVLEDDWEGVPLAYLAAPEHEERLARSFGVTPEVLAFLSELTGVRYPYAKYSQACVDGFPFGGMENVSATTLTDTTLDDERGARDGTSTGLVVHEAAHQWFGDLLTCADWSEIWLNEGFATYMTALWVERTEGADAFRDLMRGVQSVYVEKDVGADRRPTLWNVWRDPMDLFFGGHTYQGGAARLHHLRFVVGDRAFFRGIQLYVGRNAGRSVRTVDLRRAMEEASGTDLAWFFEQWFERRGFPELSVRWRHDEQRGTLYLAVNQVQDPADGTPAAFRTPVDVEVCDADGVRTTRRFTVDARRHLFEIECARAPRWVWFDRHGWIPKKLDTTKGAAEWLALAAGSDDVGARHDALTAIASLVGRAEGPDARASLARAVAERATGDASPKVRARAAELLGGFLAAQPDLRAALVTCAADGEAAVRVAALEALRPAASDPECLALARAALEEGYSWRTMAAAVRLLLAGLPPEEGRRVLDDSLAIDSPHGRLRAYLVDVLAERDDDAARDRVLELMLDRAEPSLVRQAAVRAVGRDARARPERARLMLRLLDEDDYRLRRVVLESLGARDGLEDATLERGLWDHYRATVFPRERRAIETILSARRAP